ncbi:reverse transcriptase [Senna tora]|uniref:Reverse transcriptase n=1 Tax=Senna tora TaxID=362788 RepID=A0A834X8W2_9FABA|nr:reverse transcriptase [Senna tora]
MPNGHQPQKPNQPEPQYPSIPISPEEINQAKSIWETSVIVRLVGCFIEQTSLTSKLMYTWKLNSEPSLLNIGSGFFIVRFGCLEDRWKALLHGPTIINGHFLALDFWRQGFNGTTTQKFLHSPVWIKLEGLPIEFFDPRILIRIGNSIGTFIGIDGCTHNLSIAKHARICVMLDMAKIPPPCISIGKYNQPIIIEKISNICILCGGANHSQSACKGKQALIPSPIQVAEDHRKEEQWQVVRRRKPQRSNATASATVTWNKRENNSNSNKKLESTLPNPNNQNSNPSDRAEQRSKGKDKDKLCEEKTCIPLVGSRDPHLPSETESQDATTSIIQNRKSTPTPSSSPKKKKESYTKVTKSNGDSRDNKVQKQIDSKAEDNTDSQKAPSQVNHLSGGKEKVSEEILNLILNITQIKKNLQLEQPPTPHSSFHFNQNIQKPSSSIPMALQINRHPRHSVQPSRREVSQRNRNQKLQMELKQRIRYARHYKTPERILRKNSNGAPSDSYQSPKPKHPDSISLEDLGKSDKGSHQANNVAASMGSLDARKPASTDSGTCSEGINGTPPGKRTGTNLPTNNHPNEPLTDRPPDEHRAPQHQSTTEVQAVVVSVISSLLLETGFLEYQLKFSPMPSMKRTGKFYLNESPHSPSYIDPELEESVGSVSQDEYILDNNMTPVQAESLALIQAEAKIWNRNCFGNIFFRKNRIMKRLNGINLALQKGHNPGLIKLEQILAKEYQEVLLVKEDLWAAKSRVEWLQLGDSNTSFFHSSVIERRRSNRILSLQDQEGNWIEDPSALREHLRSYFFNCFSPSPVENINPNIELPKINPTDFTSLKEVPSALEIRTSMFSLKPFKALGMDGFQAAFFQKFWDIISNDIIPCVQDIFLSKKIPP